MYFMYEEKLFAPQPITIILHQSLEGLLLGISTISGFILQSPNELEVITVVAENIKITISVGGSNNGIKQEPLLKYESSLNIWQVSTQ